MTDIRVAMVTHHSCIRVFKEGYALSQLDDVTVSMITMMTTFGFNVFDHVLIYSDRDMLKRSVKQADEYVDLFHVHNEPDWLVSDVREMTNKPVVYDIHDLESLRWNRLKTDKDEKMAFQLSDAWIHVSEAQREAAEMRHGNTKPHLTIPSYVNEIFYGSDPAGDVSFDSIVYQGGLATEETYRAHDGTEISNFRDYRPIVKAFCEQGFNFQMFAVSRVKDSKYQELGAVVYDNLPYPTMLRAIQPFGFGLVGASKKYPLMEAALPNKLFEYISQGVVPVCYNATEAADFVEEYGIGIRLDSLDNLKEQLADGPQCRERLLKLRLEWKMEKHSHKIKELYERVL